jgi:hypothetical protein
MLAVSRYAKAYVGAGRARLEVQLAAGDSAIENGPGGFPPGPLKRQS